MKKYLNWLFTALRILVGWHFLYEGIIKLLTPGWTSKLYLMGSNWIFSDLFHRMSESQAIVNAVDFINIWGLILIGLSLFIGLAVRWSSIAGAILLLFYFVAYPPIPGHTFGAAAEGSYLWVNKNLIELALLIIFAVLTPDFFYGIDRLIKRWKEEKPHAPVPTIKREGVPLQRREMLRDLISVPVLGAFAYAVYRKRRWDSFERKYLTANTDATSGATTEDLHFFFPGRS